MKLNNSLNHNIENLIQIQSKVLFMNLIETQEVLVNSNDIQKIVG